VIALLQRVNFARLRIDGAVHASIDKGMLVLIGLEKTDNEAIAAQLLGKILDYRIFADAEGRMNRSLRDIEGELMLVSQFTLAADTNSGLRPSFSRAMPPELAREQYARLVELAETSYDKVCSGVFAADMQIELENDGPVTFTLQAGPH